MMRRAGAAFILLLCGCAYFGLTCHVYCACSSLPAKDKGEKKLFGYSFVPLMQEDGRTLPDGTHELIIHKVSKKPVRELHVKLKFFCFFLSEPSHCFCITQVGITRGTVNESFVLNGKMWSFCFHTVWCQGLTNTSHHSITDGIISNVYLRNVVKLGGLF